MRLPKLKLEQSHENGYKLHFDRAIVIWIFGSESRWWFHTLGQYSLAVFSCLCRGKPSCLLNLEKLGGGKLISHLGISKWLFDIECRSGNQISFSLAVCELNIITFEQMVFNQAAPNAASLEHWFYRALIDTLWGKSFVVTWIEEPWVKQYKSDFFTLGLCRAFKTCMLFLNCSGMRYNMQHFWNICGFFFFFS